MPRKLKEYALYHGEQFLEIGTVKELAEFLGVKEFTIRFYATPTYKKRCSGPKPNYVLEPLEDD